MQQLAVQERDAYIASVADERASMIAERAAMVEEREAATANAAALISLNNGIVEDDAYIANANLAEAAAVEAASTAQAAVTASLLFDAESRASAWEADATAVRSALVDAEARATAWEADATSVREAMSGAVSKIGHLESKISVFEREMVENRSQIQLKSQVWNWKMLDLRQSLI